MQRVILVLILVFGFAISRSYSQQELLLKWPATGSKVYYSICKSVVSDNDTVYVLANLGVYSSLDSSYRWSQNALYKIADNHIISQNTYDFMRTTDIIFMRNGAIWLPNNAYVGITPCYQYPILGVTYAAETWLNRVTVIGRHLDTISSSTFSLDVCGFKSPILIFSNRAEFTIISRFQPIDTAFNEGYVEQVYSDRDNKMTYRNITALNKYVEPDSHLVLLEYDSASDKYLSVDGAKVTVFDREWNSIYSIDLNTDAQHKVDRAAFACNSSYYAVNYTVGNASIGARHFTLVFTKDGKIISSQEALVCSGLAFTDRGTVASVGVDDSTDHMPFLQEQDIYQNILRKTKFGHPGVILGQLSMNGDKATVIGTSYTDLSYDFPFYGYVYTQQLSTIPESHNRQTDCKDFIVYNDHHNLSISFTHPGSASPATALVYTIAGQKVYSGTFDYDLRVLENDLPHDVPMIVRICNKENSCVFKFYPQ